MRRLTATVVFALLLAGCEGDPNTTGYWVKKLSSKRISERVEACNRLRKMKDTQDVGKIEALLKDDDARVKGAAAEALGELEDKQAVTLLGDAVDFSASGGGDREGRAINESNKQIARALGELKEKSATPTLIKMARSKDAQTKLEAVVSLGLLRDPSAEDTLIDIAGDDNTEPFIAKKAIIALGLIGDPKSIPVIERMMVKERRGVSFYSDASFALVQIGEPAINPLLAVLNGKDPALAKWAGENGIAPEALVVKSAEVLGDIGDQRVVNDLIAKLSYKGGSELLQAFVHVKAAGSLGRLRAKAAVDPLDKMLAEPDPNIRDKFGEALTMIGDPKSSPALLAAIEKGAWESREGSLHALSNIGGAKELAAVEKWAAAEPARWQKECVAAGNEAPVCTTAYADHKKLIDAHLSRLKAAAQCNVDTSCWIGKLKDPNGAVRERAAWELGRSGKAEAIPALLAALKDEDLGARYAESIALSWLVSSPAGKSQAKAASERVTSILADDEGKNFYKLVDEELKRLQAKSDKALKA